MSSVLKPKIFISFCMPLINFINLFCTNYVNWEDFNQRHLRLFHLNRLKILESNLFTFQSSEWIFMQSYRKKKFLIRGLENLSLKECQCNM